MSGPTPSLDVSLSYFASGGGLGPTGSPYDVLLDTARLADEAGLCAVWLPERHFATFGALYPNPSLLAAAVATVTRRVAIRAGSVVLPLHHPVRVAEEWAVVDQLSHGRAGVSFAPGWHSNDFVLSTAEYSRRRQVLADGVEAVQALWRGDQRPFVDAEGRRVDVSTLPRPVQRELPTWLTSGGSRATFELAGALGANVLTHLVNVDPEDLCRNIAAYRSAHTGRAGPGRVTLMLHTFVHDGTAAAVARAATELARYLEHSMRLDASNRADPERAAAFAGLTDRDRAALASRGADRFLGLSLICPPDEVADRLDLARSWGVDEVACLVDFGFDHASIMKSLDQLASAVASR
jgi:natural product biosynthesis luciferase-like monooxygenase protein